MGPSRVQLHGGANTYVIFRDQATGLEYIRPSQEIIENAKRQILLLPNSKDVTRNSVDILIDCVPEFRLPARYVFTMLGLISAFLAIAGAALAGGSSNWHDAIGAGVLAFLIAMLIANFVFPSATRLYGQ